jgi:hypothetical protein
MTSAFWTKVLSFLVSAGTIASGATFIFGIFYGGYQYFEVKKEKRIQESLALYRQFNNTPTVVYRENIYKVLAEHHDEIAAAAASEDQLEKTIVEVVKKGQIANQLILVMDFFDGLVFCVSKNICDAETTVELFYGRSTELYTTFYQYIQLQRQSNASRDFGLGLQTIAEMKRRRTSDAPTKEK